MVIDDKYILSVIEGKVSGDERKEFFRLLSGDKELMSRYSALKNSCLLQNMPYDPVPGMENYDRSDLSRRTRTTRVSFSVWLTRVAAVLFIPAFLLLAYEYVTDARSGVKEDGFVPGEKYFAQTESMMRYIVNEGVKGFVMLPDSSKVWLNSGSTIEFPSEFSSYERNVKLSGEGYFNVVSDSEWPMRVSTSKGITVVVTGTEFNVSSYENDDDFRLTLVTGSLYLEKDSDKSKINVDHNQEVVISDRKERVLPVVKPAGVERIEISTSWKEGRLVFDNAPMDEVIRKLERWFGVRVDILDGNILKNSFTADFESESLTQVLDAMKYTSDISYRVEGRKVVLY